MTLKEKIQKLRTFSINMFQEKTVQSDTNSRFDVIKGHQISRKFIKKNVSILSKVNTTFFSKNQNLSVN